jgi:hypothetical protein
VERRISMIAFGYLAACLAGGLVYLIALAIIAIMNPMNPKGPAFAFEEGVRGVIFGAGMIVALDMLLALYGAIFAFLPALVGIIYAERHTVRSAFFYGAGGIVVGIASYALFALVLILQAGTAKGFFGDMTAWAIMSLILVFGVPGMAGGLVYWLIAGRNAGR